MKRLLLIPLVLFVLSCEDKQEKDCAGVEGGTAFENECGCVGGQTGLNKIFCYICMDIDGNEYETVLIGQQIWMKENLKVTRFNNGDEIPTGYSHSEWADLDETETGAYAVYDDNEGNVATYGYLYNWYAVDDDRGICPEGWHVPTDSEYAELTAYLGGTSVAGGKMKATGTIEGGDGLWTSPNEGATNESGFTGLPGGYRTDPDYYYMGNYGYFWSSTESEDNSNKAMYRRLRYVSSLINWDDYGKGDGFSVRCLKD